MSNSSQTKWRIAGEEAASCNCAWGCPCQFNALPTHGRCEALAGWQIQEGYFGTTRLDGVRFARIYWWPGAVHEANGTRQLIIDEQATIEQREALIAIESGTQGGTFNEIFATVCPNTIETMIVPITFESDREKRQARVYIPEIGELRTEPIKNPVTGEEHRARIVLPNGFEYTEAEVANTVAMHVKSTAPLIFENEGTYAQLNAFDWSNS
ncbi:MAG: DUF1326 domain-containing protein [Chitinophagaceae bacterium]